MVSRERKLAKAAFNRTSLDCQRFQDHLGVFVNDRVRRLDEQSRLVLAKGSTGFLSVQRFEDV
jgi:hypothetical protein